MAGKTSGTKDGTAAGGTAQPQTEGGKSMLPDTLEERYQLVLERIDRAAKKTGRKASDLILVAVTKYADPEQIKTLLRLGHRDFGENRVQVLAQHASIVEEFLTRQRMLSSSRRVSTNAAAEMLFPVGPEVDLKPNGNTPASSAGVRWHMIGHLQRNKAKKCIEFIRLTHSVDSLRIAEELQTLALKRDATFEVLLQINVAGEDQKYGCPLPAAIPMAEQISSMMNLRLRGVMCMAPHSENPEDSRLTFARCREAFEEVRTSGAVDPAPFNILSMGMSNDFEVAISEGANVVRVGSAIFGEQPTTEEPAEPNEPAEPDDAESV